MADREEPEQTCSAMPLLVGSGERHAFFVVLSGPCFGELHPLEPGRDHEIGRREEAQVPLRDDGVSRRHAVVRVDGETATIRDLGSVNGTWVDGTRVPEARLENGSRVHLGTSTTLKFVFADALEARYQTQLAQNAALDPLTGLYNRRHFEDRLAGELAAAQRHHRPVALLLCDVDHFKDVNDRFGHAAGDEALQAIAARLRGAVRKEDVLARWGGEEFVVAARETALGGASALAERIRAAVERDPIPCGSRALAITISVGVTVSDGAAPYLQGRSERDLVAASDRALYLAKQAGRNRVMAAPPRLDGPTPGL